MTEEWRPIPGWEGYYEVSDAGRVRSLPRAVPTYGSRVAHRKGRILRPSVSRGYERVSLQAGGRVQVVAVHRLVLFAFVGPPQDGHEGCHGDGDKRNNHLSNLRWDTASANHLDRTRHGKNHHALKTHCPKGHPYSPENTYREGPGRRKRKCRTCCIRRAVARKQRIAANRKKENVA